MTEQQVRDFLAQFGQARRDFDSWPKWMRDAARRAAATFPRTIVPASRSEPTPPRGNDGGEHG